MIDGIAFLDDASRPAAPKIAGVTARQRAHGRRLSLYHSHYLQEMKALRQTIDGLASGEALSAALNDQVASLTILRNFRNLGTLCGNQCQMLTMHHTIEDRRIFPRVREIAGMRAVIDRLSAEHDIVHALLERLVRASQVISDDPGARAFANLRAIFEALERVLGSHFGYEEQALEESLGVLDVPL